MLQSGANPFQPPNQPQTTMSTINTTAARLFYLVVIKATKDTTYYSAYEWTIKGLQYLAPTDTSDHKAAQKEGFYYSTSSRTAPTAYSIRVNEVGTDHKELAARQLDRILQKQGRSTEFLQVALIQTTTPHVFYSNEPAIWQIKVEAVTYRDNANGNPYYAARILADGKEIATYPCQYGNFDEDNIKTEMLNYLAEKGLVQRYQHESGANESVSLWQKRTGIELVVRAYPVKTIAQCRKGPQ